MIMEKKWGILIACMFILGICLGGGIFAVEKKVKAGQSEQETEVYVDVLDEKEFQKVYAVEKTNTGNISGSEEAVAATMQVINPVVILGEIHASNESELYFNQYQIDDLTAFINALLQFTNLQKVEMCDTNLSNEEMAGLRDLFPAVKFVWVVNVAGFRLRTDTVAFSTMFTGYGWGPETSADFEALKYCTDLEALDIGHHSITDLSFMKDLTKLKILIIAINKIEDISVLANMTELTYLELFLNKITDLTPLENLVNLEHLNLCHNKTLGDIEPILHYPNLKRLWISYCNLTNEEIARIRDAYPGAQLEFEVYESVQAGWRSTEVYPRMRNVFNTNTMDEMFLPKVTTGLANIN